MFRSAQFLVAVIAVGCLVWFTGCPASGPSTASVKGTLTIDNKPASGVQITFAPMDPSLPVASGQVSNGSFELFSGTQGKPGAAPGKYKVVLAQTAMSAQEAAEAYKAGGKGPPKPKLTFPEKYTDAKTSDKEVEVKPGPNDIRIEIPGP